MEATGSKPVSPANYSGTKRKRSNEPKFYAVRVGRRPGVYHSWNDCMAQISGHKGSIFRSFTSLTEAELFYKTGATSSSVVSATKYYAVANGKTPGIYNDWHSAEKQIKGWKKPKFKSFLSKAEAEAFLAANRSLASRKQQDDGLGESSDANHGNGALLSTKKRRKTSEPPLKGDGFQQTEPGMGPLPADAEDGFDSDIHLNSTSGKIEYKNLEGKKSTKLKASLDLEGGVIRIYTDGSALGNGRAGAVGGVGVWFGPDDARNLSEPLLAGRQTNQRAELSAILRALDVAPLDRPVLILSDSNYAIKCCTEWFQSWRSNGWRNSHQKPVENRDIIEPLIAKIEQREQFGCNWTKFEWLKGHADDPGNIAADHLAVNGALIAKAASS